MTFANRKKRKQKSKDSIIMDATKKCENAGGYFAGETIYWILMHLWDIAFRKGYDKAVRDMDAVKMDV